MIGIGIDTGGTCTDAVVFDITERCILASAKSQTTHDHLEQGIGNSLDKLPKELLHQASFLALSTTLATNACVENKGGRVFMIFIGVSEKVVRNTYRDYGFESLDDILFVEGNAKEHTEPGWDLFEMEIAERLSAYDSVAIAQMNAEENGGAYEQKAAELVRRHSSMPIVCAYHLFHDRNVIQRGASALLNARLLPALWAVPTWDIIQSLSSLTWAELPATSHWSKIICLSAQTTASRLAAGVPLSKVFM